MIDRSKIMKRAWTIYREGIAFTRYEGRERFGFCLRAAWNGYHHEQMTALYSEQAHIIDGCSVVDRIQYDIDMLPFKSSRINIADRRQHLQAKLDRIAA